MRRLHIIVTGETAVCTGCFQHVVGLSMLHSALNMQHLNT